MSGFADLFGTPPAVFLGVTLLFMGGCAFMTGQAIAATWRPLWHGVGYGVLLGGGDRFLGFALFGADPTSLAGYVLDTAILIAIALISYRLTRVTQMTTQYPWLYERVGAFAWRDRPPPHPSGVSS